MKLASLPIYKNPALLRKPVEITKIDLTLDPNVLTKQSLQQEGIPILPIQSSLPPFMSSDKSIAYVPLFYSFSQPTTVNKKPDEVKTTNTNTILASTGNFIGKVAVPSALGGIGVKVVPFSNNITENIIIKFMTDWGFTHDFSSQKAQEIIQGIHTKYGKLAAVFVSGTFIGFAVIRSINPGITWLKTIIFGVIIGCGFTALFAYFAHLGIWGGK